MKSRLLGTIYACAFMFITATADAALVSRLGGLAVYDTDLDITWLADANAGAGSAFDNGISSTDGYMSWNNSKAWAAGLTIGGISGWRLPSADINGDGTVVDCFGGSVTGCADNEMGFLYWEEGITLAAPGPFSNIQSVNYWSGTEFGPVDTWNFFFNNGEQSTVSNEFGNGNAWAVHSGDVGLVPVPGAAWLFGSGLLGLVGMARRKKA